MRDPAQQLVGITEITWNTKQPDVVEQGITVVLPEHRKRGIGRWLKATMVTKIVRELPKARFIYTGNATTNAAMLKINAELGFIPLSEDVWWEVSLAQVQAYLAHPGSTTEPAE